MTSLSASACLEHLTLRDTSEQGCSQEVHSHWDNLRLGVGLVAADSLATIEVGVDTGIGLVEEVGLVRAGSVGGRARAGAESGASGTVSAGGTSQARAAVSTSRTSQAGGAVCTGRTSQAGGAVSTVGTSQTGGASGAVSASAGVVAGGSSARGVGAQVARVITVGVDA